MKYNTLICQMIIFLNNQEELDLDLNKPKMTKMKFLMKFSNSYNRFLLYEVKQNEPYDAVNLCIVKSKCAYSLFFYSFLYI